MEKIGYVYLTTNLVNGKMYVGQHLSEGFDTGYKGSGTYIKRAFDKYGWDNFKCEIICWCSTQTQLNEAEDNYIKLLDTMSPNGYNLRGGGANGKLSKEARKNISEVRKKYFESEENRKKSSEASKKYFENEENRKKSSEASKKYWESEEGIKARKKASEANKGQIPWNKGRTGVYTEESIKKMSEANKGKVAWNKGITPSEETRKKQSEAAKKRFENEEERNKRAKKVYQYTLDGVFIKEWASASEIERVLGYDRRNISACCNNKAHCKSAYGFFWSHEPLN